MLGLCCTKKLHPVDSMLQSFLLKPEVLTPNRNGFMAKTRYWHLKAGSTVHVD